MLREVYRDHVPGLSRSSLVNQEPRKPAPFRLGVSRCLLGDEVRYDGGHKRDRFLVDVLGRYVEWVPVCPEVEAGMGTPREAIHLIREAPQLRVRTVTSGRDVTKMMARFSERKVRELEGLNLSGYSIQGLLLLSAWSSRGRSPTTAKVSCPWSFRSRSSSVMSRRWTSAISAIRCT